MAATDCPNTFIQDYFHSLFRASARDHTIGLDLRDIFFRYCMVLTAPRLVLLLHCAIRSYTGYVA